MWSTLTPGLSPRTYLPAFVFRVHLPGLLFPATGGPALPAPRLGALSGVSLGDTCGLPHKASGGGAGGLVESQVEGSPTWETRGLPESRERRAGLAMLLDPKGKNQVVLPRGEPPSASLSCPLPPRSRPSSPTAPGLPRLPHLGTGGCPPRPQPHSGFPGHPQPPWAAPSRPSNYPLGINDTLIFSEWSPHHRGEASPPFPVPNYKLLLPICLLAAQFPNSD